MFDRLVSSGSTAWGGSGGFRRWSLAGRNRPLSWGWGLGGFLFYVYIFYGLYLEPATIFCPPCFLYVDRNVAIWSHTGAVVSPVC